MINKIKVTVRTKSDKEKYMFVESGMSDEEIDKELKKLCPDMEDWHKAGQQVEGYFSGYGKGLHKSNNHTILFCNKQIDKLKSISKAAGKVYRKGQIEAFKKVRERAEQRNEKIVQRNG